MPPASVAAIVVPPLMRAFLSGARTFSLRFVWRPRSLEQLLQLAQRIRPNRTSRTAQDDESKWAIEARQFFFDERTRELLG